uniref:Uncharacterized protein n=1 Tax=Palpitomonas bilix TaxID=652834 RepID=A0A7S3LTM7_9EUKA|mmetsp:Transcript_45529/g.117679  ORF Transcript_45529/g.117679 Transcript_45529/m.117679 type:complete len:325 (+) Transcript_45529:143-1117(+)
MSLRVFVALPESGSTVEINDVMSRITVQQAADQALSSIPAEQRRQPFLRLMFSGRWLNPAGVLVDEVGQGHTSVTVTAFWGLPANQPSSREQSQPQPQPQPQASTHQQHARGGWGGQAFQPGWGGQAFQPGWGGQPFQQGWGGMGGASWQFARGTYHGGEGHVPFYLRQGDFIIRAFISFTLLGLMALAYRRPEYFSTQGLALLALLVSFFAFLTWHSSSDPSGVAAQQGNPAPAPGGSRRWTSNGSAGGQQQQQHQQHQHQGGEDTFDALQDVPLVGPLIRLVRGTGVSPSTLKAIVGAIVVAFVAGMAMRGGTSTPGVGAWS